jgi:hypothetical protein
VLVARRLAQTYSSALIQRDRGPDWVCAVTSSTQTTQETLLKFAPVLVIVVALVASSAKASEWRWSYQGQGVAASGVFTTKDAPNADGFYEITGIKGEANGVAITGLQPAGTSIPGNDGYPVDNLIRTDPPQLSLHGFAYSLADGTYANPFYGAHFAKPDTYAFFSDPANRRTSEPAVTFTATTVP